MDAILVSIKLMVSSSCCPADVAGTSKLRLDPALCPKAGAKMIQIAWGLFGEPSLAQAFDEHTVPLAAKRFGEPVAIADHA